MALLWDALAEVSGARCGRWTFCSTHSWNIAAGFEHPTKKNVENLEMVQKKSTRITSTDKHNLQWKLEKMGLIFTIEAESPDYKPNWDQSLNR